jgi:hypothetical protein
MYTYRLSVDRQAIARILGAVIAFLLVASVLGQVSRFQFGHDSLFGLVQLFNVDGEQNIPTFFTMLVAMCDALLLVAVGLSARQRGKHETVYWMVLACGFLFLSYDEGFQVHEKLIRPMRSLMGNRELGIFYFGWVVPGIAGVCALGLMFLGFLLRLPADTRRWLLISGAVYLGGAVGMELIDGKYMEAHGANLTYMLMTTVEEGLEMSGLSALVITLLGHMAAHCGRIEVRFSATEAAQESAPQAIALQQNEPALPGA